MPTPAAVTGRRSRISRRCSSTLESRAGSPRRSLAARRTNRRRRISSANRPNAPAEMPKTLHVCYSFLPDPPGGTENYVESLCRELMSLGIGATVAAPARRESTYEIKGLPVRRFAFDDSLELDALYTGDPIAASSFGRLLDKERPDLVHLHAL